MNTKELACFDIDDTLSKSPIYLEVIKSENTAGFISDEYLKKINQTLADYKNKVIDYEETVSRVITLHAQALDGQSYNSLKLHTEEFIRNSNGKFRDFAKPVISLLADRTETAVVTAEPQYLAKSIQEFLGVDRVFSTIFGVENGEFNGKVERSLAASQDKIGAIGEHSIVIAFGDSEGDIDMLKKARHAFCISPTRGLLETAKQNNWQIYDNNDEKIIKDIKQLF